MCGPAGATEHRVSSSSELKAVLRNPADAAGSEERVLRLAPGRYAPLVLLGITGPLRLEAEDPANPPELAGLTLRDSSDIRFESLVFRYRPQAEGEPVWTAPFRVYDSQNITFSKVLFQGAVAHGHGPEVDGFPAGIALLVSGTQGLQLLGSELHGFYNGLSILRSIDVTLVDNELHGLRKDGLDMAQVSDVLIARNRFHSFTRTLASGDHADMIQMWTHKTDSPSQRITIRDNVFTSGAGYWTQTIFLRNDQVDRGLAGSELFFRDILIEQNVILNAHSHGILIGAGDRLTVRNNTLIRNHASEEPRFSETLASPAIHVAPQSRHVVITGNAAFAVPSAEGADWHVDDNLTIQSERRLAPGFYGTVFASPFAEAPGDPLDLDRFRYRKDGPLDGHGIGAARLEPTQ